MMEPKSSAHQNSRELQLDVPASTSNLGPGFDFLGLCIGLWLRVRAQVSPSREAGVHQLHWDGQVNGSGEWSPSQDLIHLAIERYEADRGQKLPAIDVKAASTIPVGRGFGSSGAAVAAGLLIARAMDPEGPLAEARLLDAALDLEGHPDNATASLLGGCTIGVPTGSGLRVVRQPVHASLGFAVAWPASPLFTEEARSALPAQVPFADAVENPRRLALLLEGLRTGDGELLRLGIQDRLHERFRRRLVHGSDRACAAALEAGAHGAALSGAGSGVVAIGPLDAMESIAAALAEPLDEGLGAVTPFVPGPPVPRWISPDSSD